MKYLDKIEKSAFLLCLFSYVMYLIFEVWRLIDAYKKLPLPSEEIEEFRLFSEKLNSSAHLFEKLILIVFVVYLLTIIFKPLVQNFSWIKSFCLLFGSLIAIFLICFLFTAPTMYNLMSQGDIYPFMNVGLPLLKLIPYSIGALIILSLKSMIKVFY